VIDVSAPGRIAALEPEEIRRLASIGFHGLLNGRSVAALRLFESLVALRPGATFPLIGSALALLATGRPEEAARVLEHAQALQPDDEQVRVFLGMTLCFAERTQRGWAVLASLAQRGADMPAVRLARRLLRLPATPVDRGVLPRPCVPFSMEV
jgi:Flp pilus assembly protein TadD